MSDLSTTTAAAVIDQPTRPRAALPALCLTQITSWGIVYYAFPVLNPQITTDTGWSAATTTAAFSAALLVSALVGIRIGRILDARGPRTVMTTGSLVGTASLIVIATAPNLALFTAGWLLAGLAMASTFYQPAFAALTRWWAPHHVRALTIVTLAGGLASTVFAPLTAQLTNHFSWRHTYLILAAILAAVTVPAHAFALRGPWPPPRPRPESARPSGPQSSPVAVPSCSWPLP
ncbi:MFS transporter [Streptomyces hirsutus]